jgi:hypothetical protein
MFLFHEKLHVHTLAMLMFISNTITHHRLQEEKEKENEKQIQENKRQRSRHKTGK